MVPEALELKNMWRDWKWLASGDLEALFFGLDDSHLSGAVSLGTPRTNAVSGQ